MGSFLDKPKVEKVTERAEGKKLGDGHLSYAASAMQGWRVSMEDEHICVVGVCGRPDLALFAVFDGHGGDLIARQLKLLLDTELSDSESFKKLSSDHTDGETNAKLLAASIREAFLSLDDKLLEHEEIRNGSDHSGSTAVMCFVTPTHIVVGNCGDSRLIVVGADGKPSFKTLDHKPDNADEQQRIEDAGGQVTYRRVNGDLAVSRAIGDFVYKENKALGQVAQQVSPEPETTVLPRQIGDQFVVVACDGIWDVMSNDDTAAFVCKRAKEGLSLGTIAEDLFDECLQRQSKDNMSVVLVALPGAPDELGMRSYEDVQEERQAKASEDEAARRASK